MPHILVICTANICRSPVVEALLRERLQTHGLDEWTVSSAGTWAVVERAASRHSAQLMAERGLDISGHQSRMVEESHLQEADLILCMESGHAEALSIEFPAYQDKIYLLSEMIGRQYSIADPYGGPLDDYQRMVQDVETIIDEGWQRIISLAQASRATDV